MLIDLHAHSSGISTCCKADASMALREAKRNGLDGIVLTNHYQKSYVTDGDYASFAERYLEEYHKAQKSAREIGCKIFFGIEVTVEQYPGVHLLIYGVEESFVTDHVMMFDYTQAELYDVVKKAGGALIQAHPLRRQNRLLDVALLDGVEISCHPKYEGTHLNELAEVARAEGKLLTCGGDYHADTPYRPRCGMYLPDGFDSLDIGRYLLNTDIVDLLVQETDGSDPFRLTFCRGKGMR